MPPNSNSFFYGRIDIDDLEKSGTYAPNILTCFSIKSKNLHQQKPATFDGPVIYGLDTWITYPTMKTQQDFESMPECLEGMYYALFNARGNVWGANIMFDADIDIDIGPVVQGSRAWRRLIAVTLTFEVTI